MGRPPALATPAVPFFVPDTLDGMDALTEASLLVLKDVLVGERLFVEFDNHAWFRCIVMSGTASTGYVLKYDDGDMEHTTLSGVNYARVLPSESSSLRGSRGSG